jgi:hypothetical protein
MGGDFSSPRHRHNFEQIRYQLEGVLDYGRDGKLVAGMVSYSQAVYYGPQTQDPNIPCKTIVLQFGGASGAYLSQAEVQAGMQALSARASSGTACSAAAPSRASAMSTVAGDLGACRQSAMAYPKPRYPQPIFMDPQLSGCRSQVLPA